MTEVLTVDRKTAIAPNSAAVVSGIPSVKLPKVPKLALYSAVPPQPLMSQFDAGFIASPSERTELQRLWEDSSRAYSQLPGAQRSYLAPDDVRGLVGIDPVDLNKAVERSRLYPPFDSHHPEIVAVRIAKIVTPQLTVNLPRARRRVKVAGTATDADLFRVAFSPSGTPEPINRQVLGMAPNQGGATIFTSYDEDVRPHNPVYRDLMLEERDETSQLLPSFCIPVGGGIPFISGHRIPIAPGVERIVITNGIHRAFSLAQAGCEWLPLALCTVAPLELPPQLVELPNQLIANPGLNPPLVTDYLNDAVAMRLDYHAVLKVVRINWAVEQYVTVLR